MLLSQYVHTNTQLPSTAGISKSQMGKSVFSSMSVIQQEVLLLLKGQEEKQ
jgi:hypothetical protein